jgi:hypothetical protein
MVYVACAAEVKDKLTNFDIVFLINLALMIFFAFSINLVRNVAAGAVLLSLGFVNYFFTIVLYLKANNYQFYINVPTSNDMEEGSKSLAEFITEMRRLQYVRTIKVLLMYIFPYFPLIYILGLTKAFDANWTIAGFMIGSVVGKCLFSSYMVDSHFSMQDDLVYVTSLHKTRQFQLAGEVAQSELRHMIANVAHDLKTVMLYFLPYFFVFIY